jgi:peptidoglycan/LPS O-acetylase OafA/YrhL
MVWGWHAWVQNNSQTPGLWLGLFMLLTVVYSVIHYLYIEKPLMALSNNIKQRIFR